MVAVTWIVPILVFFVTIFGWQYFVGYRSVKEGMCYVQYMEEALFNCLLQVCLSVTLSACPCLSIFAYILSLQLSASLIVLGTICPPPTCHVHTLYVCFPRSPQGFPLHSSGAPCHDFYSNCFRSCALTVVIIRTP